MVHLHAGEFSLAGLEGRKRSYKTGILDKNPVSRIEKNPRQHADRLL